MPPGFTETFGGSVIYPSQTTYLALALTTDIELNWPIEQQIGGDNIVADIIDLSSSTPGLSVTMPDATQVTTGFTSLFNNVGSQTITVKDSSGGTIISLVSGTAWQIYLTDNSTPAGLWRTFQYGASVSVANAAALAGAGLKAITTTLNEQITIAAKSSDYVILDADRAKAIMWTSGAGNFTLPDPASVGSDWFTIIRNSGSGDLVVTPAAGLIDGTASKTFAATNSAWVITDGTNYYTLGFGSGSSGGSSFGYISIAVPGTGNYALSGAELNRVSYQFTGILTGNRVIIVPTAVQQYWVHNATTGAFTLTVKTAAGSGITVTQGSSAILYCDGTDVVIAQSTGTTFPITVGQGGTGATTAGTARTNLGASAIGDALFTSASAAAARSTIGAPSAATTVTGTDGVAGGGDLSANRTLSLDINGLTVDASPDTSADYVATYDASAAANKKVLLSTLLSGFITQTRKTKAVDTDRASTTTLTDDPELSGLPLQANTKYLIEYVISIGNTTANPGIKLLPAYSGSLQNGNDRSGRTSTFLAVNNGNVGLLSTTVEIGTANSVNANAGTQPQGTVVIKGVIHTNSAGNLSLEWAQQTSNVNNASVLIGSTMSAQPIG